MEQNNNIVTSKVELRFRCKDLKDSDTFSKNDSKLYMFKKNSITDQLVYFGKTETIKNNNSPQFATKLTIEYQFEKIQKLHFKIIDIDKEIPLVELDNHDKIGEFDTTLGDILSRPGRVMVGKLKRNGKETGTIEITAEEIYQTKQNIVLQLEGKDLDKKDLFGLSDPFFLIYKSSSNGPLLVYESEVIKNTLNPTFKLMNFKLEEICGGDFFRELIFEFYDWDSKTKKELIGVFRTNLDQVLRGNNQFQLINPKKAEKKGYTNSGIINFFDARLVSAPTFLDYINGGCTINLMVAIDCTISNKEAHEVKSLHFGCKEFPSQYGKAIAAVGSVLSSYDTDGLIDVIGFGADKNCLPESFDEDCFPLCLKKDSYEVYGVEGVLNVYYENIKKLKLMGPTYFEKVIKYAAKKSSKGLNQNKQHYTILTILTDGEIFDMPACIDELVKASKESPLSVVIVGLGDECFDNMKKLNGEHGRLKSNGKEASRDIVSFVEFNMYKDCPELICHATLKDLPTQFVSFFDSKGIVPNAPRQYVPLN